jgi:hypothetical protein
MIVHMLYLSLGVVIGIIADSIFRTTDPRYKPLHSELYAADMDSHRPDSTSTAGVSADLERTPTASEYASDGRHGRSDPDETEIS